MCAKFIVSGLLGLGMLVSQSAAAQSYTLTNSATVVASCSVATTQNISFGAIDALNQSSFSGQSQGNVQVKCTKGSYSMMLSNGMYPISGLQSGTCAQRMKAEKNNHYIVYALNTSDTFATIYPSNGNSCTASKSTGQTYASLVFDNATRELNVPIYASIQKYYLNFNQFSADKYNDTLNVLVYF